MPASHEELNNAAHTMATDFVRNLAAPIEAAFGDNFIGLYLLGSLAHGGFSRRYSDLDICLVTEWGLTEPMLASVKQCGHGIDPGWAEKLSIFWTDRSFTIGRFPPLDRLDYLDHAVPISEREHIAPRRPTHAEVRVYLAGVPLDNWEKNCARLAVLDTLAPSDHKPMVRAVLYAARFAYSWQTGQMASNDAAVAYLFERDDCGLPLGLIETALACRRRADFPDDLFARRAELRSLIASSRRLVAERTF